MRTPFINLKNFILSIIIQTTTQDLLTW